MYLTTRFQTRFINTFSLYARLIRRFVNELVNCIPHRRGLLLCTRNYITFYSFIIESCRNLRVLSPSTRNKIRAVLARWLCFAFRDFGRCFIEKNKTKRHRNANNAPIAFSTGVRETRPGQRACERVKCKTGAKTILLYNTILWSILPDS